MGFYIKYDDIRCIMDTTQNQIGTWEDEINAVSLKLANLRNLSEFQGSAAESTKAYISEVHTLIIESFNMIFQGFISNLLMYSCGYYGIDDNRDAILKEDVLEDLKRQCGSKQYEINSMANDLSSQLNSISDILCLNPGGINSINDKYACLNNQYQTLIDRVNAYETSNHHQLADLETAISQLISFINEYADATDGRGSKYKSGNYAGKRAFAELVSSTSSMGAYIQSNSPLS